MRHWMNLLMMKYSLKEIIDYFRGNLRYELYYRISPYMLRSHIREQIAIRLVMMDRQCYNEGVCKICGCSTTRLQFANKTCDKPCYPPMMNIQEWKVFKGETRSLNTDGISIPHKAVGYYLTEFPVKGIWWNKNDIFEPLEDLNLITFEKYEDRKQ